MKKLLKVTLLGLALVCCGCSSEELEEVQLISYQENLDKAKAYLEEGDSSSALDDFKTVFRYSKIDSEVEEACLGMANIYKDTCQADKIVKLEKEMKTKVSNPSEELLNLIKTEKTKKWYKVETKFSWGNTYETGTFKYDDKGRVIESAGRPFNEEGDIMIYTPGIKFTYEYIDDNTVIERVYYSGGESTSYNVITLIDGYYVSELQTKHTYNDENRGEPSKVDMRFLETSKYTHGNSTLKFDRNHNLVSVYYDDGLQPYYSKEFDIEYDDYDNPILITKSKNGKYDCMNYNKYVYCNVGDLNGDLSNLPTSCVQYYDTVGNPDPVPDNGDYWMNLRESMENQ